MRRGAKFSQEVRRKFDRRQVLGLMAAASAFSMPSITRAAPTEFSVGMSSRNFGAMAALGTAAQGKLFEEAGLSPTFVTMENGATAMAALLSGSVQLCVSGPAEVFAANARGQSVVMVANLYRGLSGSLVVSTKLAEESGLSETSPIDDRLRALDGQIIAFPSATSSLLAPIKSASEAMGLSIRYTYIAQTAMPAALAAGSIQGMMASSPVWLKPVEAGSGVLWINGPKGDLPADVLPTMSGVLSTTREFAESSPELIEGIRSVLSSMAARLEKEPTEVGADFAAFYPEIDPASAEVLFAQESKNFSKMEISAADIEHEIRILTDQKSTITGLQSLEPSTMLVQ